MIKGFIFDIGGTLIKTDQALLDAIEAALKENNIKLRDRQRVTHVFGKSNYINVKTAVETSYEGPDTVKKIEACFLAFKKIFPYEVVSGFSVFPHVIETLDLLKNKKIKLAVFTGFDKKEATFLLQNMKLSKYFDFIVTIDDVKELRPHPDALILAAKRLEVGIDECIYVGDAVADIQMAKNAKMKVVCVKTGIQDYSVLEREMPDYSVKDFSEMIKKLLNELLP